ncbi:hypothetical protein [Pseudomonas alkylphenolica]|uniref:Uncharacterized protein n=1 Tax=Pseudomonas alkylphenolica TaxID=237609 RepID=A0A077FGH0_9PSED|nr:hypothetical protein [Pseudomonas alkylphenolica]AIL63565.1 hypothetical protein PSAKL28_44220 [Pseudomonas alkylphenolica]
MSSATQEQSIRNLCELLVLVSVNPGAYLQDSVLLSSLKSQGKLSSYHSEKLGISKTSLNTLKRHCEHYVSGGFTHLDQLRASALSAVTQATTPTSVKRRSQKDTIAKLTQENAQLNLDLLAMTKLLRLSMRQTRSFAQLCNDSVASALYAKESRELLDMLSTVGALAGKLHE